MPVHLDINKLVRSLHEELLISVPGTRFSSQDSLPKFSNEMINFPRIWFQLFQFPCLGLKYKIIAVRQGTDKTHFSKSECLVLVLYSA